MKNYMLQSAVWNHVSVQAVMTMLVGYVYVIIFLKNQKLNDITLKPIFAMFKEDVLKIFSSYENLLTDLSQYVVAKRI